MVEKSLPIAAAASGFYVLISDVIISLSRASMVI